MLKRTMETAASKVTAKHVPNRKKEAVQAEVKAIAEKGSTIYTAALMSYASLSTQYTHKYEDHAVEYVRENAHTHGMENFWSVFKRSMKGTYVSVGPAHLNAYVVEQISRFNKRADVDEGRFRTVLGNVSGNRMICKELTARASTSA